MNLIEQEEAVSNMNVLFAPLPLLPLLPRAEILCLVFRQDLTRQPLAGMVFLSASGGRLAQR